MRIKITGIISHNRFWRLSVNHVGLNPTSASMFRGFLWHFQFSKGHWLLPILAFVRYASVLPLYFQYIRFWKTSLIESHWIPGGFSKLTYHCIFSSLILKDYYFVFSRSLLWMGLQFQMFRLGWNSNELSDSLIGFYRYKPLTGWLAFDVVSVSMSRKFQHVGWSPLKLSVHLKYNASQS